MEGALHRIKPQAGAFGLRESIMQQPSRGPMPAAFFGIAVGSLALANAWRVGARIWATGPWAYAPEVANAITVLALGVWIVLLAVYAHQWWRHADLARAELRDPLASSLVALLPVSGLLAGQALLAVARPLAIVVLLAAGVGQLVLGVFLHGRLWQGGRKPELVTPAIYLPVVAPSFVAGTAAAALGWTQLGTWLFGAGLFAWLAIESMVMQRAAALAPLPEAQRPLLGIQLAPPVVGAVTWLSLTNGVPDVFTHILLGYGLYQALLQLRLLPWIARQPFQPGYWAFSFGVAALPTVAMRMVERGATGPVTWIALPLFIAANIAIGVLAWKTIGLLLRGRLLPARPVAAPDPVEPS